MDWFYPSMLASITAGSIFFLLYYYLYRVYKDTYLLYWSLGWGFLSIHYLALILSTPKWNIPQQIMLFHYLSLVAGGAMLLVGTYNFTGKILSRYWRYCLYAVIVATFTAFFIQTTPHHEHPPDDFQGHIQSNTQVQPPSQMPRPEAIPGSHPHTTHRHIRLSDIPPYLFLAISCILCGISLIRAVCVVKQGRIFVGSVFVLWGIHTGLYPLYLTFHSVMPWAHLIGSVFSLLIAIGFAVIYLQKIHDELSRSRGKYRELVQSAISLIIRWDTTGKILFVNDYFITFFGFSEEELIGANVLETIHSHYDKARLMATTRELTESPDEYTLSEVDHVTKNGDVVWVAWTNKVIRDAKTGKAEILSIGYNITKRKLAEKELEASERKYRHLVEDLNDVILTIDRNHIITFISPSVERLTGLSPAELTGRKYNYSIHAEDRDRIDIALERHFKGQVSFEDFRLVTPDGKYVWVRVFARPVYDGDEIIELQCVLSDMTAHRMVEEGRERASRLESIGILAGGLAHDFNNILVSIIGNISLTRNTLDEHAEEQQYLTEAENACERAKKLTRQLLTFAKGGTPERKRADIPEVIRASISDTTTDSGMPYDLSLADDLKPVDIDMGQIRQVLNNLFTNAAQAMPGGGTIMINAQNISVRQNSTLALLEGKYVSISVKDQGTGISSENLPKIFDPYFSTKENASGLGLAIAYSIIHQHEGLITVSSETGLGSTFTIYLPVSTQEPTTKTSIPQKSAAATGRILVMDDEPAVRNILTRMLTALGYKVTVSENGEEAIDLYSSALENERFDIVIMDLTVPGGMGGKEAIKRILDIDPTVCAVVSSGYSDDPVVANHQKYGFTANISKPYSLNTLKELLLDLQAHCT